MLVWKYAHGNTSMQTFLQNREKESDPIELVSVANAADWYKDPEQTADAILLLDDEDHASASASASEPPLDEKQTSMLGRMLRVVKEGDVRKDEVGECTQVCERGVTVVFSTSTFGDVVDTAETFAFSSVCVHEPKVNVRVSGISTSKRKRVPSPKTLRAAVNAAGLERGAAIRRAKTAHAQSLAPDFSAVDADADADADQDVKPAIEELQQQARPQQQNDAPPRTAQEWVDAQKRRGRFPATIRAAIALALDPNLTSTEACAQTCIAIGNHRSVSDLETNLWTFSFEKDDLVRAMQLLPQGEREPVALE